jgi:hypothetical protein
MKQKYNDKCKLLFTDTDSLTYHIYTDDFYKDMEDNKEYFDRSDYNMTGYRAKDNTNKKVVNKMKDETNGVPIKEFVGLRSKCYSILLDDRLYDKDGNFYTEKKTAKGVKKSAVKKVINHQDYKNCLSGEFNKERLNVSFYNLKSINHNIGLYQFNKTGLSCFDDKRYLLDDGITSYAYGHHHIKQNQ